MASIVTTARGEIGEATICQVRSAANPLGELWHVQADDVAAEAALRGQPGRVYYDGPSEAEARAAYEQARRDVWAD